MDQINLQETTNDIKAENISVNENHITHDEEHLITQPSFLSDYLMVSNELIKKSKIPKISDNDVIDITTYSLMNNKMMINFILSEIEKGKNDAGELINVKKCKVLIKISNIPKIIYAFQFHFAEFSDYYIPCDINDESIYELIDHSLVRQVYFNNQQYGVDNTKTKNTELKVETTLERLNSSIMEDKFDNFNNDYEIIKLNNQVTHDNFPNINLSDLEINNAALAKLSLKDDNNGTIITDDDSSLESCKLDLSILNDNNTPSFNSNFIDKDEFNQIAFLEDNPKPLNQDQDHYQIKVMNNSIIEDWTNFYNGDLIKVIKEELPIIDDNKLVLIMNTPNGQSTIIKTVTEDVLCNRINFIQSALDSEELPNLAEFLISGDVKADVKISLDESKNVTQSQLINSPEIRVNLTSPDLIIFRHVSQQKWSNLGLDLDSYTTGELIAVADIATTLALRTNRFGFESKLLKMDSFKYKVLSYFMGQAFNCCNIMCPIIVTSSILTVKSHMKNRPGFYIRFTCMGQEIEQTIPVVFNIFGDTFVKLCEENIIKLYTTGFQFKFHFEDKCESCQQIVKKNANSGTNNSSESVTFYNMGPLCSKHYYYKYISTNPEFNPKPLQSIDYRSLVEVNERKINNNLPSLLKFITGYPCQPQLKASKIAEPLNLLWLMSRELNQLAVSSIFSVQEISLDNDSVSGVDYLGNFIAPQHGQLNKWKLLLLFSFIDYSIDQPIENVMKLNDYDFYSTTNSNIGFHFKYDKSVILIDNLKNLQFKNSFNYYNSSRDFKLINKDPITTNDLIWFQSKPSDSTPIPQRSLFNNFLPLNILFLSDIPVEICLRHNLAVFYDNLTKGLINYAIMNGTIIVLNPNHIINEPIKIIDKPIQLFEKKSNIDKLWKTNYQKQGIPRYHPEVYLSNINPDLSENKLTEIKTFLKSIKVLNEKDFVVQDEIKTSFYSESHLNWKMKKEKLTTEECIEIKHSDLMYFFHDILNKGFHLSETLSHRVMSWCKCRKLLKQMEFIISEDGDLVSRNSDDSLSFNIVTKEGYMFTVNETFLLQYHSFFHKYNQLEINLHDLQNDNKLLIQDNVTQVNYHLLDESIIVIHDDIIRLSTITDNEEANQLINSLLLDKIKKESLLNVLRCFETMNLNTLNHLTSSKLLNFQRLILVITTCSGKLRDFFVPLTLIRNQFPKQLVHSQNYPASSFEKYPKLTDSSFFSKFTSLIVYRSSFMDTLKQLLIINCQTFIANSETNQFMKFVINLFPSKINYPRNIKYKPGVKVTATYPYVDLFLTSFVDFRFKMIEYSTIGLMLRTQDPVTENKTKAADLDDSDSTYSLVNLVDHSKDILVSSLHPDSNIELITELSKLNPKVKSNVNISNNFIINPLQDIRDTNVTGAPFPRLKIGSIRLDILTNKQCNAMEMIRAGKQTDMIGLIKMIKIPLKIIDNVIPMVHILMNLDLTNSKFDELYCVFAWSISQSSSKPEIRNMNKNELNKYIKKWNELLPYFSWVLNPLNEELTLINLINSNCQSSILASTDDLKKLLSVNNMDSDFHNYFSTLPQQHVLSSLINCNVKTLLNTNLEKLENVDDFKLPQLIVNKLNQLKWFEIKNINELLILLGLRHITQRKFIKLMCLDVPRYSNAIADQFFGINNGADLRNDAYWKLSEWLDFSVTIGYFPKEEIKDRGITTANVFLRVVLTNVELFADSVSRLIPNDLSSKIDDKKQIDSYMNKKIRKKSLHPLFDQLYYDKPSNCLPLSNLRNINSNINLIPLQSFAFSNTMMEKLDVWYRQEIDMTRGAGFRDKIQNFIKVQEENFIKVLKGKKPDFKSGYICQLTKTNLFLIKENGNGFAFKNNTQVKIIVSGQTYFLILIEDYNKSILDARLILESDILNAINSTIIKNSLIDFGMKSNYVLNAYNLIKLREKYSDPLISFIQLLDFNKQDIKSMELITNKEFINWKLKLNSNLLSTILEATEDDLYKSLSPINVKFANIIKTLTVNKLIFSINFQTNVIDYIDFNNIKFQLDVSKVLSIIKPYPCCQDPFNIDYLGKGFLWFNPTEKVAFKLKPSIKKHTEFKEMKPSDVPFEPKDTIWVSCLLDFYDNPLLLSQALSATKMSKLNQILNFKLSISERMQVFSNIISALRSSKNKIKTNKYLDKESIMELKNLIKSKQLLIRNLPAKLINLKLCWIIDYFSAIKSNISCRVDTWRATEDKSRFCTTVNSSLSSVFAKVINNPKLREFYLKLLHMWKRKIFIKPVIMNILHQLPDSLQGYTDVINIRNLCKKIDKKCNHYNDLFATVGSTMSQGMLGKVAGVLIGVISNIINCKTIQANLNLDWMEEVMVNYTDICDMVAMIFNLTVDMCMVNTSDDGAGVLITHFYQRGTQNSQIKEFPKYCKIFMRWYFHLNNRFGIKISHDKSFYFLDIPIQEFNSCFFDHSFGMNKIIFNEYQQALNIEGHLNNWNDILNFIRMKTNIILELHPKGKFTYITALNYFKSFKHTLNLINYDFILDDHPKFTDIKKELNYLSNWLLLTLVNPELYGEEGFRALTLGLIDAANSLSWSKRNDFISKNKNEFDLMSELLLTLGLPNTYDDIFLFIIKVNSHYLLGHMTFEETKLGYVQKESVGKYYSTLRGHINLETMLEFIMNHTRLTKTELLNQFSKAQAYSKVYSEVLSKSLFWDLMQLSSCLNNAHSLHFNHNLLSLPNLIKKLHEMISNDNIIIDQPLIDVEPTVCNNPFLDYQILEPLSNANKNDFKLISMDLKDMFFKLFNFIKNLLLSNERFISDSDLTVLYRQLNYPRVVQLYNAINYFNKKEKTVIAISTAEVLISFNSHVRAYNLSGVISYKISDLLLKWNNMSKWFQDNLMVKFTKTHVKLPESDIKLSSIGQLISPDLNKLYPFEVRELNYNLTFNLNILNFNDEPKSLSIKVKNKLNSINLPNNANVLITELDGNIEITNKNDYLTNINSKLDPSTLSYQTKPILLFNEILELDDMLDVKFQFIELMTPQWNKSLKSFRYRINAAILINTPSVNVLDLIHSYIKHYPSTNQWLSGISIKSPETITQVVKMIKKFVNVNLSDILWIKPIKNMSPIILTFNQLIDKLAALQQNDFVEYWLPIVISYDVLSLTEGWIKPNTKTIYPSIIKVNHSKIIKLGDLSSISPYINETISEAIRLQKLYNVDSNSNEESEIHYSTINEFICRAPIKQFLENLQPNELQFSDILSKHTIDSNSISSSITSEFMDDKILNEPSSCNLNWDKMLPLTTIIATEPIVNSKAIEITQYEINRLALINDYINVQTNFKQINDQEAITSFKLQFSVQ